jgi:uncharacterized protein YbjQ (UPF0145 family)
VLIDSQFKRPEAPPGKDAFPMLVTTTNTVEGAKIREYAGVVSGEVIFGANVLRDFMAGIRDIVGGRADAYEQTLREAREAAMGEMIAEATRLGANGVIGVDIDYETVGSSGSMLLVSASGTAVILEWEK